MHVPHLAAHHQLHVKLQELLRQLAALSLRGADEVLEQPLLVVSPPGQRAQQGVVLQQLQQRVLCCRGVAMMCC